MLHNFMLTTAYILLTFIVHSKSAGRRNVVGLYYRGAIFNFSTHSYFNKITPKIRGEVFTSAVKEVVFYLPKNGKM